MKRTINTYRPAQPGLCHVCRAILLGLVGLIIPCFLFSQDSNLNNTYPDTLDKKSCQTKDMVDYIRSWFHIKKKEKEKNASIFFAPILGSTPSTGFIFGATLQGAFQLPTSKMSAFQATATYGATGQLTISMKNNLYAAQNKFFLSGDWSYFNYNQPTYGLGTDAPYGKLANAFHFNNVGEPVDSLVQPMKFRYLKLHQTFSFNAKPNFFVGPGVHFDYYSKIEDQSLDTLEHLTSHYVYSKKYGFDPERYVVMGVSLNLVYDSRDNMINAYKGIYANLNYRINPTWMGSDKKSSTLWAEFRSYLPVSKKQPSEILAFWVLGWFTLNGEVPYLNLPALGNDQRQKTGRGYLIARYRGNHMMYGEAEFRFPISRCTHTLGGVVFVNATTTSNKDGGTSLFDYVRPGIGAGLRILFQKKSRMNIQVDYGKGKDSGGIYFGASEVF